VLVDERARRSGREWCEERLAHDGGQPGRRAAARRAAEDSPPSSGPRPDPIRTQVAVVRALLDVIEQATHDREARASLDDQIAQEFARLAPRAVDAPDAAVQLDPTAERPG
jgi:hypothetical protein